MIIKFFNMMKHATRYKCANVTKTTNEFFEKQITRLKKMIRKLKRMVEKTKDTIEENIWAKITIKQSTIAISTFFLREINVFSKRRSNKEMNFMIWIKKEQEMKRVQKMNATKIIALTYKLNINNTLIARKNIIKIRRFKKLMIFKIIFEESKKYWNSTTFESRTSFRRRSYDARNSK